MPKKANNSDYSGADIQVLEGLDPIRKRAGMYIGSTDSKGLQHLIWEIFDNSVDEAIAGFCDRIELALHEDGSIEIEDNGRGMPVDIQQQTNLPAAIVIFTTLHSGGKFGGKGYATAGGLHGVGAAVVNALSTRVDLTVYRDGNKYEISFNNGEPGIFDAKDKFTPQQTIKLAGKAPKNHYGTKVRFYPNKVLFTSDAEISRDAVVSRARQTAFLVSNVTINVRDLRNPKDIYEETFSYKGGTEDMVEYYSHGTKICDTVHITGSGTYVEKVPMPDSHGRMHMTELERTVHIDISFQWNNGYDTTIKSFCNVVTTPHGGTHQEGFKRALLASLRKGYEGTRILKQNDDPVTWDDVVEGLTAVISVSVPEPQFVGQTKEELGTPGVLKAVQETTAKGVKAWLEGRKKTQARTVLEKIANAAKTRVASRTQREAARRKTALEGASMPAKLVDCRATGISRSELYIVEGDSALGSARAARNSEYQALLPIRGKILNVQKATLAQVLGNAECASIIQVIGAGSGRSFDLEAMRYHRIILMADADVDGSHIRALLITLVYKYMKPVIEAGRLYTAVPPLHKIETTGRNKETIYTYTATEMEQTVAKLEKAGKTVKKPVPRFKGLGEMDAVELWDTTMNPEVRSLRKITMGDAMEAEKTLELLMGDKVEARREWIIENSAKLDLESIDA
jgi:DNA gyrase subunit B